MAKGKGGQSASPSARPRKVKPFADSTTSHPAQKGGATKDCTIVRGKGGSTGHGR
jgi:hypothetical protein